MSPASDDLVRVWFAGVAVCLLWRVRDRIRLCELMSASQRAEPSIEERYAVTAEGLGVNRVPKLRITEELESPALVGLWSQVVLIPSWMIREADQEQLDWALRHELMHCRQVSRSDCQWHQTAGTTAVLLSSDGLVGWPQADRVDGVGMRPGFGK